MLRYTPELDSSISSSLQPPSTRDSIIREIDRTCEITSATIDHHHQEEGFTQTSPNTTGEPRSSSDESSSIRTNTDITKPKKPKTELGKPESRRRKAKNTFTPRKLKPAKAELRKPPPPGNKAGGDGALEASTSRKQTLI
ncbi:hypothetical protein IGI04_001873 [Brassica rapa subsp. trilocularis]|uniref:Uncharacterized protein n=1 Tax=Brassica rapa subsp. trilocularis TaxID=1813537 RepID=A0ABQ7NW00_BRACM|nr:hypothetical protein IGI04_001873 [Brassica rapa subsp. trilocularis]